MKKNTPLISKNYPFLLPLGQGKVHRLPKITLRTSLQSFIEGISYQLPNIKIPKSLSVEQKILAIFQSKEIRLGSAKNIINAEADLCRRLKFFTEQNIPTEFTLLAIPFKTGNPLKVNRIYPDLGEVAFLLRLRQICELIQSIYEPGAKFIILTEGLCLAKIMGISKDEAVQYRNAHISIIQELGFEEQIIIKDLFNDVVAKIIDFREKQQLNESTLKREFENNNPEISLQVQQTLPTIQTSINIRKLFHKQIEYVYKNLPADFQKRVLQSTLAYLAFHKTRYDTLALERAFPNAVRSTLTPRLGRLGLTPVNKATSLFPHHGVGVLKRDKTITVMYEHDIRRLGGFREVFLGDKLLCFEEI